MTELFERVAGAAAALLPLPDRGHLLVTGADRVRFLNGQLTTDVDVAEGRCVPSLLLDRKGHVHALLYARVEPDRIELEVLGGRLPQLREALDKHLIADDVELAERGDLEVLAVEGPGTGQALAAVGVERPEDGCFAQRGDLVCVAGGARTASGARLIAESAALAALRDRLGLPELSEPASELLRIAGRRPSCGADVTERTLVQEARLETAVSFSKGCFVGQEIVERIRSRGAVNRLLVLLQCSAPVAVGDEIQADGARDARVTSAAAAPDGGALALGYLPVALAEPGTRLAVGGVEAQVIEPAPDAPPL